MNRVYLFFLRIAVFAAVPSLFPFTLAAEEAVEEVEEVEVIDVQDAGVLPALSFAQLVGRNHAAAVHLPIGFLVALCLMEVLRTVSKKSSLTSCGWVLSIAAALSFLPAATTGWLRADELFEGKSDPQLFLDHRNLMIIAWVVLLTSLGLRIAKKNVLPFKLQMIDLALLTAALMLVAVGAHHGGMLVYGEQFLPY